MTNLSIGNFNAGFNGGVVAKKTATKKKSSKKKTTKKKAVKKKD